ncbi:MAG: recombination mediator RecR [Patescibacteria group bacterium]
MNPRFKQLVKLFQKLPGVGPRQGARFVLSLLDRDDSELKELGTAIVDLKKSIHFCRECFNVADDHLCTVCSDARRNHATLMVMEKVTDLDSMEKTGLYKGLYHVLGGTINPVNGVGPDKLRLKELSSRVASLQKKNGPLELVLATNPTTEGETTALYIRELFKKSKTVTITRLARGLSSGSNLEYTDETTLKNALEYRK